MVADDVTIGELSRRIADMNGNMNKRLDAINTRMDSLQFVNRETYTVQMGHLIDRVDILEERGRWQVRTLVAAFIFPLLVAVIVGLMLMGR